MEATLPTYDTWHKEPEREVRMGDAHAPYWRHFIASVPETDLLDKSVLDFGCNRGGFLRLLHALRPFRRGLGVDIARQSIAAARSLNGNLPIEYEFADDLSAWTAQIDIAFSYEVIYLLPDLQRHTEQMQRVLRDGGVYYAVTGCHTDSHLWPRWRTLLKEITNAPVQDYSPEDYINAFADLGLPVSFRKFGYDGFVPAPTDSRYYPKAIDALIYPADDKLLFCITKPAGVAAARPGISVAEVS